MIITWLGHSCFKVEKEDGYTVIFDPTEDAYVPGIDPIREDADLIICSHEHGDHNARHVVSLKGGEKDCIIDEESKAPYVSFGEGNCPFIITTLDTFHDDKKGSLRGKNRITILDDGSHKIAHFGDLGCMPEREQLEELQGLDVAFIPVGGFYTIDGIQAGELIKIINPRIVIPMHFRDDSLGFGFDVISTVDVFLNAMGGGEFKEKSSVVLTEVLPEMDNRLNPESKNHLEEGSVEFIGNNTRVIILEPKYLYKC